MNAVGAANDIAARGAPPAAAESEPGGDSEQPAASPAALFVPPPQIDEYRILRSLGRGGMGQVFLGPDSLLDRPVAVKFLVTASPTEQARLRFLQEARAIARLQHPNVVAIYRVGIFNDLPFLVSEYVTGSSLNNLHMPLPWQKVLRIGLDLARGLCAVHRHGVLHRDIKPAKRGFGGESGPSFRSPESRARKAWPRAKLRPRAEALWFAW